MSQEFSAKQEVWRGLLYGQRSMMLRLSAELKRDFGLNPAQFEAMLSLAEAPQRALPATQLSSKMLYSSGSGSHLISRLEELGHVKRDRDAGDARVVVVALTDRGYELIAAAVEAHAASLHKEFSQLITDEELPVLLAFARRLATHEAVNSKPFLPG